MISLHELQRRFAAALRGDRSNDAAFVVTNGIAAHERLSIYRNNVRANFSGALISSYPAVQRLVGDDYFAQLSEAYCLAHPSTSGDLQHVGERFSAFLQNHFAGSEYAYLADVAAFEWAYQCALIAADQGSTIVARIVNFSLDDIELLTFTLHPSAQLIASAYPVLAIWRANRDTDSSTVPPTIDLRAGASRVLLLRREREVELLQLSAAEHQFLLQLQAGATLPAALGRAHELDPDFAAANALPRFVQLGVIVDCQIPGSSP
jgi:hypothetical protein